jgi:curved DNA-binding protein
MAESYYDILGVSKSATDKEIKSAYRRLARKHHPDVNPGDRASEERFKQISEAYEVLSNPENRAAYDRFGPRWQQAQKAGAAGQDFDPGFHFDSGFDEDAAGDFASIFGNLFGGAGGAASGRGGRRRTRVDLGGFGGFTPQPQHVEANVEVSLEEAYSGAERQISIGGQRLAVKIPPGVKSGGRIRLAGKAPGRNGASGDLFLNVTVREHRTFKRDGDNLLVDVSVPYLTAALGGEVSVPTMTGRVAMKVPAGIQSGQSIRLQGKGMPRPKSGGHGDLLAKAMITVPKELSARERELLTELAAISAARTA